MLVSALKNFDHGGTRKRGDLFDVSDLAARRLREKGLVRFDDDPVPIVKIPAAGENAFALPAAQVSQKKTAKKSKIGKDQTQSAV